MDHTQLEKQLRRHEGFRKHPYKDTEGYTTIGFGRNLTSNGISKMEARLLLRTDISIAEEECKKRFPFFEDLDGVRQEAVVNIMFNLGWPRLKTFKMMLAALEDGDFGLAAAEALDSKWHIQVKGRAEELAEQIRTGKRRAD